MEDEWKVASEKVEDIQKSPEASTKQSKALEDQIRKLKGKATMEEDNRCHFQNMLNHFTIEDPYEERREKFTLKVSHCENQILKLREEIERLDTLHHQGNHRLLNALDVVCTLNKEIKDLKDARKVIMRSIQNLTNRTRWPRSFTPSSIVGDIANGDLDHDQIELKPCSLCGKSFPKLDVVMGSCGCLYHPWCILTQCWISRRCENERCKNNFTSVWMKSIGLANIDGKLVSLFSLDMLFRV